MPGESSFRIFRFSCGAGSRHKDICGWLRPATHASQEAMQQRLSMHGRRQPKIAHVLRRRLQRTCARNGEKPRGDLERPFAHTHNPITTS